MAARSRNPFNFGDLALDETFTDREVEIRELKSDIRNGQNVVVFAPRRFGKSSLVSRTAQELVKSDRALIAQVDLMRTTTKEQLAAKLAASIYEDIASPVFRAREKATQVFRGLRITPVITVDPMEGTLGFSFSAGQVETDIDATLERLFELPAELAGRGRKPVAVIFDEFQEVLSIDPHLPALMRAVFQSQLEVAHVYLGSKRTLMEQLFNDANEPFWRSARQVEIGVIPREAFTAFIRERFATTGRGIEDDVVATILDTTGGHPYATQELCYSLWEEVPQGGTAGPSDFERALAQVLKSENAHFTRIWEKAPRAQRQVLQALAEEPLNSVTSDDYRRRHGLPAGSTVQGAVDKLVEDELLAKDHPGAYRIAEPFLAEWLLRYGR